MITKADLYDELTMEQLKETVDNLQEELSAARKEYSERRTTMLRSLMETKRDTDAAIQQEMVKLGYNSFRPAHKFASSFWPY
jgi:uncharacterized membrane protein (DUF106 family)